jgi:LysM repeat protein
METQTPSPQTGGLKLMTVFIVVLALHVAVIGGISAWHLFKGSDTTSEDLAKTEAGTQNKTEETTPANAAVTHDPATEAAVTTAIDNALAPTAQLRSEDAGLNEPVATAAVKGAVPAPLVASKLETVKPVVSAPVLTEAPPMQVPVVVAEVAAPAAKTVASYTVVKGDTLTKIAREHGMKVPDLKRINGLKADSLKLGQKLKVKSSAMTASVIPAPAAPVSAAVASKVSGSSYVVAKGDTVSKIARKFNTTPVAIMSANGISNPTKLKIGAKLVIPSGRNEMTETQPVAPIQIKTAESADLVMAK